MKKQKTKYNKDSENHISSKDIKNDYNSISNANNNSNNYIHNYLEKKQNIENKENIIYDYKNNKILSKKNKTNSNLNNFNNSKKFFLINNNEKENSDNIQKELNERLKTEYNDNSLEEIDKMYEEDNTEEINQKSLSFSKHDSFRFLYPEIYIKDDEYYYKNKNNNFSNDKKEKELDETESPLKIDTEKLSAENSGVLSFDQVKDIICYNNMNNIDKKDDFLFKKNERQIYDNNYKNKYLNFFFKNNINNKDKSNNINNNSNNNDIIDDVISFKTNANFKYPSSIFSIDTEYSSKMKKKYNKNLVKNI